MEGGSLLVSGITKRFGGLVAVKEMSFAIQAGEILGLAGTNYATAVACAAGYRSPDDKYATMKKVRFKPEDIVVRVL